MIGAEIDLRPTASLVREHELILRMLQVFERFLDEADETGRLDGADGAEILDFLRTFADRCHHAKEEDLLFPRLLVSLHPGEQSFASRLQMEHHEERHHLRALALQLEAAASGDVEALAAFSARARSYVALQRDHIARENRELFPMAERRLDAGAKRELARAFEEAEIVHRPETQERMRDLARRLCLRYSGSDTGPGIPGAS